MTPERWTRIDEILQAALELPEKERAALVRERCGHDTGLRREVERLLDADRQAQQFLETPLLGHVEAALADLDPDAPRPWRAVDDLLADPEPPEDDLPEGSRIGRYVVRNKIGQGGMGRVYAAWDPELDRLVAVKLVHLADPSGQARPRLLREAQALARVSHPNVVTIYDTGPHEDGVFLAMEHVEGGTLADWLASGEHSWREVLNAFLAAARGLAAAHDAGIVHRDFKPTNVLRDREGRLRVADFGLARAAHADLADHSDPEAEEAGVHGAHQDSAPSTEGGRPLSGPLATPLTGVHRRLGTPPYMAPEQDTGGVVGPATDQFAFCVALYHALYGEHPFGAGSAAETRARRLEGRVSPPSAGTRVPAWLRTFLLRGLRVAPERRWDSMDQLIHALERGAGRRRRVALAAGVAAAAAVGALLVALFLGLWRPAPVEALSVAVLPFTTDGPDPEDRYLGEGITDGLISSLKGIEELRVPDRSSVYALRDRNLAPPEMARQLDVAHLLQGTAESVDGRLRVTARLIEVADGAKDGAEIWSQTYDRPLEELFALQEELAREVVAQLEVEADDGKVFFQRPTESLEAYSLYLRGRDHWNQRTAEGLSRAVEYFQRALEADADYALAYAGLADAYSLMPTYDPHLEPDAMIKARSAAERALQIDPDSAQAHASLAMVLMRSGELDAALQSLETAVDLDPRYATARHWYGVLLLRYLHRPKAAVIHLELARRQDPVSSSILAMLAGAYYQAGLHQRALEAERELRVLDPQWHSGNTCIARNYIALRQWREAIEAVAALEPMMRDSPACQGQLTLALHFVGDYEAELAVAERGLAATPGDFFLLSARGGALAALGRIEEVRALVDGVLTEAGPRDFSRYALHTVMGELRVHGYPAVARETAEKLIAWHRERFPDGSSGDLTASLAQAVALEEVDRSQEAAEVLGDALAMSTRATRRAIGWSDYRTVGMEGWLAALAGRREEAWSYLRTLDGLEASSMSPPYGAIILATLNEWEQAEEALRARFEEGLVLSREIHVHPDLSRLLDSTALGVTTGWDGEKEAPEPQGPGAGSESSKDS